MSVDEYISELEALLEDNGITISYKTVERLAKRAAQLESDTLSEEDILNELIDILPKKYADNDEICELFSQFSDIVLAEVENCDTLEDDEE